jgi:gas vesicle protein
MTTGKTAIAVMAGAAIGLVLGVLFAPNKGATTIRKLLHKKNDVADDMKERFDALMEEVKSKTNAFSDKSMAFAENSLKK